MLLHNYAFVGKNIYLAIVELKFYAGSEKKYSKLEENKEISTRID